MKREKTSIQRGGPLLAQQFPGQRIIPAGEFKPACLRLMDEVSATGVEIVITKHNRPVARLVPAEGELRPFIGRSSGVIQMSREDLMAPIGEDWEVDADL